MNMYRHTIHIGHEIEALQEENDLLCLVGPEGCGLLSLVNKTVSIPKKDVIRPSIHTSKAVRAALNWEVLVHLAYSPGSTSSNYNNFTSIGPMLVKQRTKIRTC